MSKELLRSKWIYIFGIVMILFPDTIIALREFAGGGRLHFLIMPTYYLARICITFSLMIKKNTIPKLMIKKQKEQAIF